MAFSLGRFGRQRVYLCMVKYAVLGLLTILLCSFAAEHKFYMSLTDVHYNEEARNLELTSRFFTDDVERAISSDEALLKINESMDDRFLPLLEEFYEESVAISWNSKEQELVFLGYEVENELLWCYAEVRDIKQAKELSVEGRWLFDQFDDQVNIINVHIGDVQSAYLNPDDRKHVFSLKQ